MITYPNCKINLGLHVVGKRADGYHDLETIFLPVFDLCDELEITPLPATHSELPTPNSELRTPSSPLITQEGIQLDSPADDNLCLRAWRLLHEEFGIPPVAIRLRKRIPFGAGLGGGSSDAAFTLRMLNEMFTLSLDDQALALRAARLGADCPFFVYNRPAYATGIGDVLTPIDLSILNSQFSFLIEIPDGEHVSTREAYCGLTPNLELRTPDSQSRPDLREAVKRPLSEWRQLIVNDFEASVFPAHPAIATLKEDMYRRGALYASMTGSGAAVFGIFPSNTTTTHSEL